MRGPLLIVAAIALTVLSWGVYGPVLHNGQSGMSDVAGQYARLRPLMGVGFAYFAIAVVVPLILLTTRGEQGVWTRKGTLMSLFAGGLGACGALGIIMSFTFGGRPTWVMPLVFGGAPVINAIVTIHLAKKWNEVGPVFLAGLLMVVMGAVTVLVFKPSPAKATAKAESAPTAEAGDASLVEEALVETKQAAAAGGSLLLAVLSACVTMLCWGSYGPALHKGQAAMKQSRMRPLLCVGLSYFVIAVAVPWMLLQGPLPEPSSFSNVGGTAWSLGAGTCGALGALGIILAFTFGGKPVYVMPLVFGGAPVVNTIESIVVRGGFEGVPPLSIGGFLAGLMLVIVGAAMVLIFAPKGAPPKKAATEEQPPTEPTPAATT